MIRNEALGTSMAQEGVRRSRAAQEGKGKKGRPVLSLEVTGLFYFLLLLALGVTLVWQPAEIAAATDKISRLEGQLSNLKLENEGLKRALSEVESLSYVENVAKNHLGMVAPTEVKAVAFTAPENVGENKKIEKTSGILSAVERIAKLFGIEIVKAKGSR